MSAMFLRCSSLHKRFRDVKAVDGADLLVAKGRTTALLGPSGCGKTTMLRMIAGFEVPDAGEIELGGRILNGPTVFVPPEKRRIGLVFQDYALFPHLSVGGNIAFGLRRGRPRRQRVAELLELVGLAGLGDRRAHQLSGGQQQRVALARSLAAEPELLLLDEPFSNLDPAIRARVRVEVEQIIERAGTTAIFVTHDQEEALSIAHEVAVMLNGRIAQVGAPAQIYRQPATRAVAEFLGDANVLPARVRSGKAECELGVVTIDAVDGPADLLIRPEALSFAEGGHPAVIIEREYYGHDQMVTVRTQRGTLLKSRLLSAADAVLGEHVGLEIKGDVVAFPSRG